MKSEEYQGDNSANHKTHQLTRALFIIYMLALFWILLFKLGVKFSYMGSRSVNLVPFNATSNIKIDIVELVMNVIIFIPLGIYAGILFKRWTFTNKIFFVFAMSLMFEALQYILKIGAFDITDIITNTSGGITGLLTYLAIEKAFNNSLRAQKFINVVAAIGTGLMILFLVLLKINLLPIRYQ